MSESLRVCAGCGRHVRAREKDCPFCAASSSSAVEKVAKAAAVALTVTVGMTLSACYGGPPMRPHEPGPEPNPRNDLPVADPNEADAMPIATDGGTTTIP
jgi:hypothetical protein